MNPLQYNENIFSAPIGWLILGALIWLFTLGHLLSRRDCETLDKILWFLVLSFVPVFGVIFYFIWGPEGAPAKRHAPGPGSTAAGGSDVAGTPWADDPGHTREG